MKRRTATKIHRNFKLVKSINDKLVQIAEKTGLTQTKIVEMALQEWLAVKR